MELFPPWLRALRAAASSCMHRPKLSKQQQQGQIQLKGMSSPSRFFFTEIEKAYREMFVPARTF